MIIHHTKSTVAIATTGSANRKTGPMIQIWIIDRTRHPSDSRKSGRDSKHQCKGCPLASYSGCYVMDMPLAVIWHRYQAGAYPTLRFNSAAWREFFTGQNVRFGAYGNPSCLPICKIQSIVELCAKHTGYFHDWHMMPARRAREYGRYLMASTHPDTYAKAKSLGLRTFTTGAMPDPDRFGIECLADSRGITCAQCGLCDGTGNSRKVDIWIRPHGYQLNRFNSVTQ